MADIELIDNDVIHNCKLIYEKPLTIWVMQDFACLLIYISLYK